MSEFTFISYSRNDGAYVQRLADLLTSRGIKVFFDTDSIRAGDRWEQVIEEKARTCASMIVVMSPGSKESDWVRKEYNLALSLRTPIFPLLLAGEPFFSLSHIQYQDVRGGRLPSDVFVNMVREGRPAGATGATSPVRRPYYFDGTNFFEPADLVDRMQQRWNQAEELVGGGEREAFDAWLVNEVRDTMLPANILRSGTVDERIARLGAHFRGDKPPVFRGWTVDPAGLGHLGRLAWSGDKAAIGAYGVLTRDLLTIFAAHEGCAALGEVARKMRDAVDTLANVLSGRWPTPGGVQLDLLHGPSLAVGEAAALTAQPSGGLLAALCDDDFAAALASDLASAGPPVERTKQFNDLIALLPTLPEPERRTGLVIAALSAESAATVAAAERQRQEAEAAEARRQQADAERHRQLEAWAGRSLDKTQIPFAEAEFRIERVVKAMVAAGLTPPTRFRYDRRSWQKKGLFGRPAKKPDGSPEWEYQDLHINAWHVGEYYWYFAGGQGVVSRSTYVTPKDPRTHRDTYTSFSSIGILCEYYDGYYNGSGPWDTYRAHHTPDALNKIADKLAEMARSQGIEVPDVAERG